MYNRWGQEVFSTNELEKGWDGRLNAVAQPPALYVWMAKAIDIFGKVIIKKGTSILIK